MLFGLAKRPGRIKKVMLERDSPVRAAGFGPCSCGGELGLFSVLILGWARSPLFFDERVH